MVDSEPNSMVGNEGLVEREKVRRIEVPGHSSGEDEDLIHEHNFEEDVFTHFVVEALRKRRCHEKTVRGFGLLTLCVSIQLSVSVLLYMRCSQTLMFFGDSITNAITHSYDDTAYNSPGIKDICGEYEHEVVQIAYGHGVVFRNSRDWAINGKISNQIDQFRYMLRLDFKMILTFMITLWMLRCLAEFRLGAHAFRSFLHFTNDKKFHEENRCIEDTMEEDGEDVSMVSCKIVRLTRPMKFVAASLQALRILVCFIMFFCGCFLLFTAQTIVDLILNSMALEFIFTVDELIVESMTASRDQKRMKTLEMVRFKLTGFFRHMGGSTGRMVVCCSWLRFFCVTLFLGTAVYTHHLVFSSYLSRAQIICLTAGLTDGTDENWRDAPHVPGIMFPAYGVCESFVNNYAGFKERQRCVGWKTSVHDPDFARASCDNVGDLGTASWLDSGVFGDGNMRRGCTALWFGQGLEEGADVPALRKPGGTLKNPRMFGCSVANTTVKRTDHVNILHYFLKHLRTAEYEIECSQPAYGPKSAIWAESLMDVDVEQVVPPDFYYQYDKRCPIERQVKACDALESTLSCDDNECRVLAFTGGEKSCQQFCEAGGLICVWAAEEQANTCKVKEPWSCDKVYEHTSDLLCQCRLAPGPRACGMLGFVQERCPKVPGGPISPCRVLVSHEGHDKHKTCKEYCATAGLKCKSAEQSKDYSCWPSKHNKVPKLNCDTHFQAHAKPNKVCECEEKKPKTIPSSAKRRLLQNQTV